MPRFDLLTSIHKAIRAMIYETGGALQTADFADDQGAARAVGGLEPILGLLKEHHEVEEEFVFPRVRPFEEEIIDDLQAQHQEVERLLGAAGLAMDEAKTADAGSRVGAGVDLNRRYNELTGFYLQHLAHEEATLLPATWRHFDDAQLMAIQGAIMSSMQPGDMMQSLQWMFRGSTGSSSSISLAEPRRPCRRRCSMQSGSSARRPWRRRSGRRCANKPDCDDPRRRRPRRARTLIAAYDG